jgi:ABC-type sugar transport system ATPase subunit
MSQSENPSLGPAVLELVGISKSFGSVHALQEVSLEVRRGEVVSLLGENGAGKSTLMKILSGVWPSGTFAGEIRVHGQPIALQDTRDGFNSGIAMIHQELAVFPELTVSEHLELDRLSSWIHWSELHERVQKFLDQIGFHLNARDRVGDLPVGRRQLVEIARALYRNAEILIFDEPTSALTESEVLTLYRVIDDLRTQGKAIIYITHRMDEVFRLSDRMVILRDGRWIGELAARDQSGQAIPRTQLEPQIIRQMVGREVADLYPPKAPVTGAVQLEIKDLTLTRANGRKRLNQINLNLKQGEILGLAGLLGSGRSEIFESLFGVFHPAGPKYLGNRVEGTLRHNGRSIDLSESHHQPSAALGLKIAFVSEDRKASGLILNQSISNNMLLPALASRRIDVARGLSPLSSIDHEEVATQVSHWSRELKVKCSNLNQEVRELSGGNQQKVVIAKWLMTHPEVLILDEPTRGIDVGAKAEIYQWISKLASQGMSILLASSEMPELLGLCHRILVLREGHIADEISPVENLAHVQERIMKAASL